MSVKELNPSQLTTLWSHLHAKQETTATSTEQFVAELLSNTNKQSITNIIMACLDRRGDEWDAILSALLDKPLYKCAPGETAFPLTDTHNRPIPSPKGHRFGQQPDTSPQPTIEPPLPRSRPTKRDPRTIVEVVENPKIKGSKAYERFALYTVGMTVDAFIEAGGRKTDIAYDTSRGYIKLGYGHVNS